MRRILAWLGWADVVWVMDMGGEAKLRVVQRSQFGGYVVQGPFRPAILLPDGTIKNGLYMEGWMPYRIRREMAAWMNAGAKATMGEMK